MKNILIAISFALLCANVYAAPIVNTEGSYPISQLAVAGDDLVIGAFDGKLRIYNPALSKHTATFVGHNKPIACISADASGRYILSAAQDGRVILWDKTTGSPIKQILRPGSPFRACALTSDGKYALAGYGAVVDVWDTKTWENVAVWEPVKNDVYTIAIDESGTLAAVGGKDGTINIFSIPSGRLVKTLKAGKEIVVSVAFAPNSGLLISGGYDKIARIWNIADGKIVKEISRHNDTVRAVAAAAGGKRFATAGDDGGVFIWDLTRDGADGFAPAGTAPATALALDPALRFIAAGKGAPFDNSRYVTLWYPKDKRQSRNIFSFSDATVTVSPIGYVDGSGSFSSYVTVQDNGRKYPLTQVAQKYNRPDRLKMDIGKGYVAKNIKTPVIAADVAQAQSQQSFARPKLESYDKKPPVVTLNDRMIMKIVDTAETRVTGKAVDESGIAYVIVNGKEASLDKDGNFIADVLLKIGDNTVSVKASDIYGNVTDVDFNIMRNERAAPPSANDIQKAAPLDKGKYYALVIGINDYQKLPKLASAVNDADAVAEKLKKSFGFDVTTLINADATREGILRALNNYRRTLRTEDKLLIFYAGHGVFDKPTDTAYWLPYDADKDDDTNWLESSRLTASLKSFDANQILLIADSCYAGTMTRSVTGRWSGSADRAVFLQKLAAKKSRILIASGGNEPVTDTGARGHSVFTNALLDALGGMKENTFTSEELFVNGKVKERVAGKSDQTPLSTVIRNSGHDGGDFIFIKRD